MPGCTSVTVAVVQLIVVYWLLASFFFSLFNQSDPRVERELVLNDPPVVWLAHGDVNQWRGLGKHQSSSSAAPQRFNVTPSVTYLLLPRHIISEYLDFILATRCWAFIPGFTVACISYALFHNFFIFVCVIVYNMHNPVTEDLNAIWTEFIYGRRHDWRFPL